MTYRAEVVERLSISGVQVKLSLRLKRGEWSLTDRNGEFILKPRPEAMGWSFEADLPANEHLTMQLASQVFGIRTAVSACIRFSGGELAYLTRRFDLRADGSKIPQEDFCQLSRRSPDTAGRDFKYQGSYEELGRLLRAYCPAYPVEVEKLFRLVVFNYAFSNGDAHLKNFSLTQTDLGDFILTPAYDLLCTRLHLQGEEALALDLFDDDTETRSYLANGFHTGECFLELAARYGMQPRRARAVLDLFPARREEVAELVARSLLSEPAKDEYQTYFEDRLRALAIRG